MVYYVSMRKYQRGEITVTLSLLGIFISLIGIGIGAGMTRSVQQGSSQAQTGSYPYRSVLEIRDEDNKTIKWMPGLIWATTYEEKIAGKNNGDIKDKDGNALLVWDTQDVPPALQGTKAQVSVGLPSGYKVVSTFCTSTPQSICDNMITAEDSLTFAGISIEKNGYVQYGVRVTKTADPIETPVTPAPTEPTKTPTPTEPTETPVPVTPTVTQAPLTPISCPLTSTRCTPKKVEISELSKDSVEISWEEPEDYESACKGQSNSLNYWIDIVNLGGDSRDGYIACTSESGDTKSTCKIGKNIFPNRLLNKESQEFKNKSWIDGQSYKAQVFLHNPTHACVSTAGEATFTYAEKKPEPDLFCKSAGQDCKVDYPEKCTASNREPGLRMCHKVGSCSEPGDESKCSWDTSKGSHCSACESTGPEDSCKYLGGNPNATERVVFLPVGFGSVEEFERIVTSQMYAIEKTNIAHYKDRFNYSIYTKIGGEGAYGCKEKGDNDDSCASNDMHTDAIRETALKCNGNIGVVVVPSQWNIYFAYAKLGKRVIVLNSSGFQDTSLAIIHEMGHAIYGLADEYTREGLSQKSVSIFGNAPNCSFLNNGVCKWGQRGECIQGCSSPDQLYRPSEHSIMNSYLGEVKDFNNFNQVSLDAIDAYFAPKAHFALQSLAESAYKNAMFVHLKQPAVGVLELQSVQTKPTYPDDSRQIISEYTDAYYTLDVRDVNAKTLWSKEISQYSDNPHDDKAPELVSDIYEYLPYFTEASSVRVTDSKGGVVLEIPLQSQNIAPPFPAGDLCGNAVCDAGNGETAHSCRKDCGEHLVKSEMERSDLDANRQVNTLDILKLTDENVYGKTADGDIDADGTTNALDFSILLGWIGSDY